MIMKKLLLALLIASALSRLHHSKKHFIEADTTEQEVKSNPADTKPWLDDFQLTTPIKLGSRTVQAVIDTTSFKTWVQGIDQKSKKCDGCPVGTEFFECEDENCKLVRDKSNDIVDFDDKGLTYGGRVKVAGDFAIEKKVEVAGKTINNVLVGLVNDLDGEDTLIKKNQGVFGLAYGTGFQQYDQSLASQVGEKVYHSEIDNRQNIIKQLSVQDSKVVQSPVFSYKFEEGLNQLNIGESQPFFADGDFTNFENVGKKLWSLKLDHFRFGKTALIGEHEDEISHLSAPATTSPTTSPTSSTSTPTSSTSSTSTTPASSTSSTSTTPSTSSTSTTSSTTTTSPSSSSTSTTPSTTTSTSSPSSSASTTSPSTSSTSTTTTSTSPTTTSTSTTSPSSSSSTSTTTSSTTTTSTTSKPTTTTTSPSTSTTTTTPSTSTTTTSPSGSSTTSTTTTSSSGAVPSSSTSTSSGSSTTSSTSSTTTTSHPTDGPTSPPPKKESEAEVGDIVGKAVREVPLPSKHDATFDTTTRFIWVDQTVQTQLVKEIKNQLNKNCDTKGAKDVITCPCSDKSEVAKFPELSFLFNGQKHKSVINNQDYVEFYDGHCYVLVRQFESRVVAQELANEGRDAIVLPNTFLKQNFVQFDQSKDQIQIAKSREVAPGPLHIDDTSKLLYVILGSLLFLGALIALISILKPVQYDPDQYQQVQLAAHQTAGYPQGGYPAYNQTTVQQGSIQQGGGAQQFGQNQFGQTQFNQTTSVNQAGGYAGTYQQQNPLVVQQVTTTTQANAQGKGSVIGGQVGGNIQQLIQQQKLPNVPTYQGATQSQFIQNQQSPPKYAGNQVIQSQFGQGNTGVLQQSPQAPTGFPKQYR